MFGDFKISQRLQWLEFVVVLLIVTVSIGGLILIGNMYPDMMSAPIAIGIMALTIVICTVLVVIPKRERTLTIDQSRWTVTHDTNGKVLMDFDLALPHCLAIAIRQGITGKYEKTMRRWMQIFIAQNGMVLCVESRYLEAFDLTGVTGKEWYAQVGPPKNDVMSLAATKVLTYDETKYLRDKEKIGTAVYGLSAYHVAESEELFRAALVSAEPRLDRNVFINHVRNIMNSETTFAVFKKEFMASVTSSR